MLKRKRPYFYREKRNPLPRILAIIVAFIAAAIWLYQYPVVQQRFGWRIDAALTGVRTLLKPIGKIPTPDRAAPTMASAPIILPAASPTPRPTEMAQTQSSPTPTTAPLPTVAPTAIPEKARLDTPRYERQDWNNCGPASLAIYLRYYGWEGDQFSISNLIKPIRADRNVNVDELTGFVTHNVPDLQAIFRVGGDLPLLRRLIAAGIPVMIEETFYLEEEFWFKDDRWSGHYLLLTGYDEASGVFYAQDSFVGSDRAVSFTEVDKNWQSFNRVYLLVFKPEQADTVMSILGSDWDVAANRQHALDTARAETRSDRGNAFTWFNLGSNLVYFERYEEATEAYDTARELGIPQRMLRYQFGPFLAYFHTGRNDDLLALTKYALEVTPNSEEALLWDGWAKYRAGQRLEAAAQFQDALEAHPDYPDAVYALNYLASN